MGWDVRWWWGRQADSSPPEQGWWGSVYSAHLDQGWNHWAQCLPVCQGFVIDIFSKSYNYRSMTWESKSRNTFKFQHILYKIWFKEFNSYHILILSIIIISTLLKSCKIPINCICTQILCITSLTKEAFVEKKNLNFYICIYRCCTLCGWSPGSSHGCHSLWCQ